MQNVLNYILTLILIHVSEKENLKLLYVGLLVAINVILFLQEGVSVARVANEFPAFYIIRRFLTVLTEAPPVKPILSQLNESILRGFKIHYIVTYPGFASLIR
jgi:hypothetical protein